MELSNFKKLLDEISNPNPFGEEITLVGATKMVSADEINKAIDLGLKVVAENKVQEFRDKTDLIDKRAEQHFIGHLQTNKVEKVVKYFDYIHSVDSLKLAKIISETACQLNKREKILLQVNLANEEQKFGYTKEGLKEDFKEIYNLSVVEDAIILKATQSKKIG